MATADEQLPVYDMNINRVPAETQYLRREMEQPPLLAPPKHPHGSAPLSSTHSNAGQHRAKTYGNDNSSVNRQSRAQGKRPDPISGEPYSGPLGQKMGSALLQDSDLREPAETLDTLKYEDQKKAASQVPQSFHTPHQSCSDSFRTGLEYAASQRTVSVKCKVCGPGPAHYRMVQKTLQPETVLEQL